jgi:hypothetical protein
MNCPGTIRGLRAVGLFNKNVPFLNATDWTVKYYLDGLRLWRVNTELMVTTVHAGTHALLMSLFLPWRPPRPYFEGSVTLKCRFSVLKLYFAFDLLFEFLNPVLKFECSTSGWGLLFLSNSYESGKGEESLSQGNHTPYQNLSVTRKDGGFLNYTDGAS